MTDRLKSHPVDSDNRCLNSLQHMRCCTEEIHRGEMGFRWEGEGHMERTMDIDEKDNFQPSYVNFFSLQLIKLGTSIYCKF